MSLTVSYYNPKDLMQLSSTYRENLYEQQSNASNMVQRSPQLSSVIGNQASVGDSDTDQRYIYGDQNLGEFGKVEHDQKREAISSNRSPEQSSSKPLGIISIAHDRYSYTRNCPTGFIDPTGHTECDSSQAWGGIGLLGSGTFTGLLGVALVVVGVGELSAGAPTIVGIFVGIHSLVVGVGMTAGGYVIFKEGIRSIIDSGCIPGVDSNSSTTSS